MSASCTPRKKRQVTLGGPPAASTRLWQFGSDRSAEEKPWTDPWKNKSICSGWGGSHGKSWTDPQRVTRATPSWFLAAAAAMPCMLCYALTTFPDSWLGWIPVPSIGLPLCPAPSQHGPAWGSQSLRATKTQQPNFLVSSSADCWISCLWLMCLVSPLLFLPMRTAALGLWALVLVPQAQATVVYHLPLALALWSPLLFLPLPSDLLPGWWLAWPSWSCPFHTGRHSTFCFPKPQTASVLGVWASPSGSPFPSLWGAP